MTAKRQRVIKVSVSELEYQQILERKHTASVARYLRELALDQQPRLDPKLHTDPALLQQLVRIGNNLNQIAKGINSANKSATPLERLNLLSVLLTIERDIIALRQPPSAALA
jgi:hypothetical protein